MMHCLACKAQILQSSSDDYMRCLNCGSYCINSSSESATVNMNYFNNLAERNYPHDKLRQFLIRSFTRLDRLRDPEDSQALHALDMDIIETASNAERVLEIGFGNGVWLNEISRRNPNVFGIDLSPVIVSEFQKAFPRLARHVSVGSDIQGKYDLIFANALFEHLDDPDAFLKNVRNALSEGGKLVLGFPIVSDEETNIILQDDINFWSPCHRIIFSLQGFREIATRNGFEILVHRSIDIFVYRLMNAFLQRQFREIHKYRDPALIYPQAPDNRTFLNALWAAFSMSSYSKWYKVILVQQTEITQ